MSLIPRLIQFSSALHEANILTDRVEVRLEFDDWWKLYNALGTELRGMNYMAYDGRGFMPGSFTLMGIQFRLK